MVMSASSFHPGGANFAFADGSVKFLKDSISSWQLTNQGGNLILVDATLGTLRRRWNAHNNGVLSVGLLPASRQIVSLGGDGLLVRQPENFSWLTSGAMARGVLSEAELPLVYFSADQRWLIASNVDTQRLFDEEIDGRGSGFAQACHCAQEARELFPEYPGPMPSFLPKEWLEPLVRTHSHK